MIWNRYFFPSFLVLSLVGLLHWIGSSDFYYWTVWWYDVMMHFLGGVWVALAVLWVSHMPFVPASLKSRISFGSLALSVFVVGLAWEAYELVLGFSCLYDPGYASDTIQDLIMDTLGALCVAMVSISFTKKQ
jgi:hypothetical protein